MSDAVVQFRTLAPILTPSAFGDIVVLPMRENMDRGKTFAFFEWTARNAKVPACNYTQHRDSDWTYHCSGEKPPDYVLKADMDTFLVLPEVERRLRHLPRTKLYWGRECVRQVQH